DLRTLGPDGQHVALDVQVDRRRVHPGQVELRPEVLAVAPGVHRHHRRRRGRTEQVLGQPVQLTKRISAHQHHGFTSHHRTRYVARSVDADRDLICLVVTYN